MTITDVATRFDALAAGILRPARPHLVQARASLEHRPVRESWEGADVRKLFSSDWLDSSTRRFGPPSLCGTCEAGFRVFEESRVNPFTQKAQAIRRTVRCRRCAREEGVALETWPCDVSLAIALASDAPNAPEVERLARELFERLPGKKPQRAPLLVWQSVDPTRWPSDDFDGALGYSSGEPKAFGEMLTTPDALAYDFLAPLLYGDRFIQPPAGEEAWPQPTRKAPSCPIPERFFNASVNPVFLSVLADQFHLLPELTEGFLALWETSNTLEPDRSAARTSATLQACAALAWEGAAEHEWPLPRRAAPSAFAAWSGRTVERHLNPFEPLLAIWRLGYVLHDVSELRILLHARTY
jgi:hypothetical protein